MTDSDRKSTLLQNGARPTVYPPSERHRLLLSRTPLTGPRTFKRPEPSQARSNIQVTDSDRKGTLFQTGARPTVYPPSEHHRLLLSRSPLTGLRTFKRPEPSQARCKVQVTDTDRKGRLFQTGARPTVYPPSERHRLLLSRTPLTGPRTFKRPEPSQARCKVKVTDSDRKGTLFQTGARPIVYPPSERHRLLLSRTPLTGPRTFKRPEPSQARCKVQVTDTDRKGTLFQTGARPTVYPPSEHHRLLLSRTPLTGPRTFKRPEPSQARCKVQVTDSDRKGTLFITGARPTVYPPSERHRLLLSRTPLTGPRTFKRPEPSQARCKVEHNRTN